MSRLTFGSLFAGIGGFDLGLERAGMECRWQVEIDPFAQRVLAKHWPDVKRYGDIRECGENLERVDVICGGFPCQDISLAGKGAGLTGERSGLWSEMLRLVCLIRPAYVVVENVAALLGRGMGTVLGDLAANGYDAEWSCIRASDIGAPHGRDRIWIVAYPQRQRSDSGAASSRSDEHVHDRQRDTESAPARRADIESRFSGTAPADAIGQGRARLVAGSNPGAIGPWRMRGAEDLQRIRNAPFERGDRWPQPLLRRVDDGVPGRVDRLRAVGNAVVPQIPEWIGRRIVEYEMNLESRTA